MRPVRPAVVLCLLASVLRAAEVKVESKIESVGLFKNGLAVVERSVDVAGAGAYRIEDVPTPVHGTFFIESASAVTVRATTMLVDVPLDLARAPLQDQLAGKKVAITLRENGGTVSGVVSQIEPADKAPWDRDFANSTVINEGFLSFRSIGGQQVLPMPRFLVVDTDAGRTLVDQSMITTINVAGAVKTAKQRKPVLVLNLPEGAPQQKVRISYLTQGLAWAPSYRVSLVDDKKLSIEQNAVIKNELADLKDVEVYLISGYPSVDFAHVTSPLALTQTWSAFFQQLSARPGTEGGAMRQQAIGMNSIDNRMGEAAPVSPPDESIDVHYESIGKQTLGEGDALALDVARGDAEYERIVEWIVPDTRDENGRYYEEYRRRNEPDRFDDHAWDAVKFKNPLPFAMTTAPATFMQEAKFLGQQLSRWVNRGEETTLRITKALSIRTRASEQERQQNDRDIITVGGKTFRKVTVDGELSIRNYRKTDTKVLIKRQFSGEMISADEKPTITLREEGVWSVNKRNQLEWTLALKAGEEKTLKYAYTALVYH